MKPKYSIGQTVWGVRYSEVFSIKIQWIVLGDNSVGYSSHWEYLDDFTETVFWEQDLFFIREEATEQLKHLLDIKRVQQKSYLKQRIKEHKDQIEFLTEEFKKL